MLDLDLNICSAIGEEMADDFHSISPVIAQTSNFSFKNYESFLKACEDEKNSYMYTRGSNPTTKMLEEKLARLEKGERCKIFSSGMGAISATLISLIKRGEHILVLNTVYGQAMTFIKYLEKFGVEYTNIKVDDSTAIEDYIKENTRLIYMESPSSQHMELLDIEKIARIAKEKKIKTVIDNTWATPIFQKPLEYGVDVVVHSCSKYIGGNSDVVAGAVISRDEIVQEIFEYGHQNLGATNAPLNSWLLIRSLRTLPMRMDYHSRSVQKIVKFLTSDSRIRKVYHPFCGDESQKKLAEKYLKGHGSLLSFELCEENFESIKTFVNTLKCFKIGVSWGGHESLILPAFKGNNEASLKQRGISKSHIRIYVGLEDTETLISDLKNALNVAFGS